MEGSGPSFSPHITAELLQLLFTALQHTNRFVRETGYKVMAAIVSCPGETFLPLQISYSSSYSSLYSTTGIPESTMDTHWTAIAGQLATGLADNWSQVRRRRRRRRR